MRFRTRAAALALVILAALPGISPAQNSEARKSLDAYLSQIGAAQYDQRARIVAAITTREQAERRQAEVRAKILALIGGLPDAHGPVHVKTYGSVSEEGFRIEKVAYESLPNYYVTADVFVPATGSGPFPAVILSPGHGPGGKIYQANWGANFARNGVIALSIDVFGAGERLQHYDPELESSKLGDFGEHEHAGLAALLIGKHISRYFITDGMRSVDYLIQRHDVDPAHIGAFGCSGGGTATAYLGALDPRISVTATACYITSLKELLPSTGAQDAEQTIPNFAANGLDLADWVELTAPRPYAIVSTTEDMFPFAGAQATYKEAKRFYSLYGAADQLQFITGPGGHGNLMPIAPQIMSFLLSNLKQHAVPPAFEPYRMEHPDDLLVTPTGQVSTSIAHSESVEALVRQDAAPLIAPNKPVASQSDLAGFQQRVRDDIRSITAATAQPGPPPDVTILKKNQRDGYRIDTLSIHTEPGLDIAALAIIPDRSGPKPAVLILNEAPIDRMLTMPEITRLAKSHIILILQARGTPDADSGNQNSILGPNTAIALQAMMVGKSLVGMRTDDAIRAVNWLVSQPDVDKSSLTIYGRAAEGMVALHAAALDSRITHVVAESTLISYRLALAAPLHRNLSDIVLPGVLLKYDTPDLIEAICPRPVVLVNPAGAMGITEHDDFVHKQLATVFETDRNLGLPQQMQIMSRSFFDPLPID